MTELPPIVLVDDVLAVVLDVVDDEVPVLVEGVDDPLAIRAVLERRAILHSTLRPVMEMDDPFVGLDVLNITP